MGRGPGTGPGPCSGPGRRRRRGWAAAAALLLLLAAAAPRAGAAARGGRGPRAQDPFCRARSCYDVLGCAATVAPRDLLLPLSTRIHL